MCRKVFFIQLLLLRHTTQRLTETRANCNDDVSLKCSDAGTNFLSVIWYKYDDKRKFPIIRRDKGNDATQKSVFPRTAGFGEKHSLVLANVTPEDSGSYECAVRGDIGGRNSHLEVKLIVNACVIQPAFNSSSSEHLCPRQVEEVPFLWVVGFLLGAAFTKIILALITIGVFRAVRARFSRQGRRRHQR